MGIARTYPLEQSLQLPSTDLVHQDVCWDFDIALTGKLSLQPKSSHLKENIKHPLIDLYHSPVTKGVERNLCVSGYSIHFGFPFW